MIAVAELRREEILLTNSAVVEALDLLNIKTEEDCERLLTISYDLGKRIEQGESQLRSVFEIITERIEKFEDSKFQLPSKVTPEAMMEALMIEHGDNQSTMGDVAPRTTINMILNGKRKLTRNHIEKLCKKYKVTADWFYPETCK